MTVHKIFRIITNYLGLNFYEFELKFSKFIAFHILVLLYNLFVIFYCTYFMTRGLWYTGYGIFSIIQIYQCIVPLLMQYLTIFRALLMRNQHKKLMKKIKESLMQNENGKCEINFLLKVLFIISLRIIKLIWARDKNNTVFNSQGVFTELTYCSNDLMFVYHVDILIEHLEKVDQQIKVLRTRRNMKIIKHEICKVFLIKRDILQRYSIDIFTTILFNFVLLIICFYWLIMRVIFNHLQTFIEFATFLHFQVSVFIYWTLFSKCEKFHSKVN